MPPSHLPEEFYTVFSRKLVSVTDRLHYAATSKAIGDRVFNDSTTWREIIIPASHAQRLTDKDLKRLLVRVDAATNTRVLSLCKCDKITGKGLAPLRTAQCLEVLDLRTVALPPAEEHWCWSGAVGKEGLLEARASPAARVLDSVFIARVLLKMLKSNKAFHTLKFASAAILCSSDMLPVLAQSPSA